METTLHTLLISKKQKLQQISLTLKERFLGLDTIIDEVISLMMPWYLFPEAQRRPTIINLWGLTGSGKTALVQAIVELLEHRKLYSHIDMGEFESDSATWIKSIFTDDLAFFDGKPSLICLDEFQFARTLDGGGNELGKDKLRVIWELLDSGKMEYIPDVSTYHLFRADNCIKRLQRAVHQNVLLTNGKIEENIEAFQKIFDGFYFDNFNRNNKMDADYFTSHDFVEGLFHLIDDEDVSQEYIRAQIKTFSLEELTAFVLKHLHARPATKILDLSQSLIFVLGNLDEAYSMSHNMNPDICADEFHEQTSRITIADIKRALRKRFRPEQIARLGNNHVIYKSFNRAQFRMLIRQELKRVSSFVHDRFKWTMTFDESVVDIVYAEGVFPSQGTRPVLTTVKNMIESRISSLVVTILEYQLPVNEVVWVYQHENFVYTLYNAQGQVLSTIADPAKLKLENLRKSIDPGIQAHTAVHEAGHAVLAALTLRIIPTCVVSRTASDAEGFCLVKFPKGPFTRDTLQKDIVITLGGYAAEKLIFGEAQTCSGVHQDIEEASSLANKAVRKFAMGSDPLYLAVKSSQEEDAFFQVEQYAAEAVEIIRACEAEATALLSRNKMLLLKMAEYLTTHSRMDDTLIEEYVRRYAKEEWVSEEGFVKHDAYFTFDETIKRQLKALETEETDSIIEKLWVEENVGVNN